MRTTLRLKARGFSHAALIVFTTVFATGCAIQLPFLGSAQPVKLPESERSPELIRDFEQKIAAKLLVTVPAKTAVNSQQSIAARIDRLDLILNRSGINTKLLSPEQKTHFSKLENDLASLRQDQKSWLKRNHLTDLYHAPETDQTEPILKVIETNLTRQAAANIRYPAALLEAAIASAEDPDENRFLARLTPADNPRDWMKTRLEPYFSDSELTSSYRDELQKLIAQMGLTKDETESQVLYRNPLYQINNEQDPGQLTLDLFSLHLEEALSFQNFGSSLSIKGTPTGLLTPFATEHDTIVLDFARTAVLPAYEFQTLAYQASGGFLATRPWSFRWRQTLAIANGIWNANQLKADGYYSSLEAELGFTTRQQLMIHFGVLELMIAAGDADMAQSAAYLKQHTPYTGEQIEMLLVELLATDGSFAAASLLAASENFSNLAQDYRLDQPKDLETLLKRPSAATAPAES